VNSLQANASRSGAHRYRYGVFSGTRSARSAVYFAVLAAIAWSPADASAAGAPAIAIVSGTPQSATAFIAQHGPRYETAFDTPLVVKVAPLGTVVRFRCITPDCTFAASVQPDAVSRVDPRSYDVKSDNGTASIKLLISTATVESVIVTATPVRTPPARAVRFVLHAR
jgi:hypothetical protein